jgi:hypothetical protein
MMKRLGLALALVLLAAGALFLLRVPIAVRFYASDLSSADPNERARARAELLALPREAIEPVFPDLVAQEVAEEAAGQDALVLVGRRRPPVALAAGSEAAPPSPDARAYEVVERIRGDARVGESLVASGPVVCPTAMKLLRADAPVELAVLARRKDGSLEVRVAIPIEPGRSDRVLAAVRAKLGP